MATMLNGAAVMDAALLLIAGNESCPQPQTSEHLAAIEIMKLKHIIILQNKIDLMKETQANDQYEQIVAFVQGTVAEGAPIIPISAQLKYNIEVLCEYICKKIPVRIRTQTADADADSSVHLTYPAVAALGRTLAGCTHRSTVQPSSASMLFHVFLIQFSSPTLTTLAPTLTER